VHPGFLGLFGQERGDVGLEETGTNAKDDETDREHTNGCVGVDNDRWRGRGSENDVTNDGDQDGDLDGLEATEVGVSDVGTDKWHQVGPELVKSGKTGRSSLTHAQSTRLTSKAGAGRGTLREILLNKVGDCNLLDLAVKGTKRMH